jgi:hypothetical protein
MTAQIASTPDLRIVLSTRRRGKQSALAIAEFEAARQAFADALIELDAEVDFKVSARGWCYILEEHGLAKGDFDKAEDLINDCRKEGLLPIDFTAEDEARAVEGTQEIDDNDPTEEAQGWIDHLDSAHLRYTPFPIFDTTDVYVEMVVEKIDLKSLFRPVCEQSYVPITNARGWSDINSRARMAQRFAYWEAKGKTCVLLYCGDHDPGGLIISDTIRKNLNDLSGATGWTADNLIIERFGLNADFINEQGLTWIDNLETASGKRLDDPSHADHSKEYVQGYIRRFGVRKCEANALVTRPEAGRQLCRDAIERHIMLAQVEEYEKALAVERERVHQEIVRLRRE